MKKVTNRVLIHVVGLTLILLGGCHGTGEEAAGNNKSALTDINADLADQNEIVITKGQFEQANMKLGEPETKSFSQHINANGYIVAAPNGIVNISTLIQGRVKKINVRPGDRVLKDHLLFTIEGREIIKIQQDYAESYNRLVLLKANYSRALELSKENVAAKKDLIVAETEYNSMLLKNEGLKTLLKLVNIDASVIENGSILSEISVFSPLNGYVTELNIEVGEFIEPNETIIQLIDPNQLQLDISVFKQDVEDLVSGLKINFYDPDNRDKTYNAELSRVGKTIDVESRTIHCTASLNPKDRTAFINNTFVETEIITCMREALSLPQSSLLEEDGKYFVLTWLGEKDDEITFKKTMVNIGVIQGNIVEVLDTGLSGVLVEGIYNLFGE